MWEAYLWNRKNKNFLRWLIWGVFFLYEKSQRTSSRFRRAFLHYRIFILQDYILLPVFRKCRDFNCFLSFLGAQRRLFLLFWTVLIRRTDENNRIRSNVFFSPAFPFLILSVWWMGNILAEFCFFRSRKRGFLGTWVEHKEIKPQKKKRYISKVLEIGVVNNKIRRPSIYGELSPLIL